MIVMGSNQDPMMGILCPVSDMNGDGTEQSRWLKLGWYDNHNKI